MTLLGDAIRAAMSRPALADRLIVTPLLDPSNQIGPGTIDLRLGTEFIEFGRSARKYVDVIDNEDSTLGGRPLERKLVVPLGSGLVLHPGQFILGSTLEFVSLPRDMSAQVVSRSSWGRLGLIVATAVAVQPGYKGVLTLELVNAGAVPIVLRPGMRVAQMQVWVAVEATSQSYSELGKYQVPVGPQGSRVDAESLEGRKLAHIGNILSGQKSSGTDFPGANGTLEAELSQAPEDHVD